MELGLPDCPAVSCDAGNDAYATLIADGCASVCDEAKCKDNYFALVYVHDNCPHEALTQDAEEGLHDLEVSCGDFKCNSGTDESLECHDHDHGPDGEGSGSMLVSREVAFVVAALVAMAL